MTDTATTEIIPDDPEVAEDTTEAEEATAPDATEDAADDSGEESDTFPREVVEKLRAENAKYRVRAQHADTLAQRLHTEIVRATGKLADPSDLPFDETHLDDPEALAAAIDELLSNKPHLGSRRPSGDIGQGQRGPASEGFSLLGLLKERA